MVIANIMEYGPAKNWPHDSEIFDREGYAGMQHLSACGWEKEYIPMYCQEAQMTRGDVELKKGLLAASSMECKKACATVGRMAYPFWRFFIVVLAG